MPNLVRYISLRNIKDDPVKQLTSGNPGDVLREFVRTPFTVGTESRIHEPNPVWGLSGCRKECGIHEQLSNVLRAKWPIYRLHLVKSLLLSFLPKKTTALTVNHQVCGGSINDSAAWNRRIDGQLRHSTTLASKFNQPVSQPICLVEFGVRRLCDRRRGSATQPSDLLRHLSNRAAVIPGTANGLVSEQRKGKLRYERPPLKRYLRWNRRRKSLDTQIHGADKRLHPRSKFAPVRRSATSHFLSGHQSGISHCALCKLSSAQSLAS
jgi:hypothetical protein